MADRRAFLGFFAGLGVSSSLVADALWAQAEQQLPRRITREMFENAAAVAGFSFSPARVDAVVEKVNQNLVRYFQFRHPPIENAIAPPLYFNPITPGMKIDRVKRVFQPSRQPRVDRPGNLEEAAFWPVTHLAELIRSRQVTSVELTEMYLARLKRFNDKLNCVVTFTEDLAMRQAKQADREIAAGEYRGPLHGIPWGAKDVLAARGYPTTWGAAPFKNRIINEDATVVSRRRGHQPEGTVAHTDNLGCPDMPDPIVASIWMYSLKKCRNPA